MPPSAQNGGGGGGFMWPQTKIFVCRVHSGRMFMVFATLLIMSVSGSGYMFGLRSNDIKSSLGYDQTTLNLLSFFEDLGGNPQILAGLVYEIAPPWAVLSIGSIMNFFGYFMMWLAVNGRLTKPHLWQMCLYVGLEPIHSRFRIPEHYWSPAAGYYFKFHLTKCNFRPDLHRSFLDHLRSGKFPLLCLDDGRILAWSPTATALCNHFRTVCPKTLQCT